MANIIRGSCILFYDTAMATWVGIGSSRQSDSVLAGKEAATKALESMGSPPANLLIAFSSVRFDQEALLRGIVSVAGISPVIGCSTAGEIISEGPQRRSVAVMAVRSDSLQIATGVGLQLSSQPRQAGQQLAMQVTQAKLSNPNCLLIFPDGITGNAAEAIRGIQDTMGLSFPIVGGCAADDFGFKQTFQYLGDQVYSNAISGALLAGPNAVGIGARHGWKPLGKPQKVTRAMNNIVQEIEGQPAVRLYEGYFGKNTQTAPAEELAKISIMYPLGFSIPGEEEYLLRNAIQALPNGSLVFSGEVPEGSEVRLMMGSKTRALEAAKRAAEQAVLSIAPQTPCFGLVFSCTSRAQLFGRDVHSEIALIRRVLGEEVPLIGFYDYGEQAPLSAAGFRGLSYFHNESVVVVVVAA